MNPHFMRSIVLIGTCVCISPLLSQGWTFATSQGPSPRIGHAMAFDSQRAKTVLFGGVTTSTDLGDTWLFDGTTWSQASVGAGPGPRSGHCMVYDSVQQRVMLFGGTSSGIDLGDLWAWDGAAWTQLSTTGPSSSGPWAMAFDAQRGRLVLCGSAFWPVPTRPMWEWDGSSWMSIGSVCPGGGYAAAMAYDSARGRSVIVGGDNGFTSSFTCEWDGTTCTPMQSGPPFRAYTALAYDSQRLRCVMFGGYGGFLADTWELTGSGWAQLPVAGPVERGWHAMAFDSVRGRTVLFGGQNNSGRLGDTWLWTGAPGAGTSFGIGCGSPPLALNQVAARMPTIGSVASVAMSNTPSPLAFIAFGWSSTNVGPFQLPVPLGGFGMPGCSMLQSTDVLGEPSAPTGPTSAAYDLAVPFVPTLIGAHVYLQGWAYAPGSNAAATIVSNGISWAIGF